MEIPELIYLDNRCRLTGTEAFVILLCRLSYPNRLSHYVTKFGKSESYISRVVTYMVDFLYRKYRNKLQTMQQDYLDLNVMAELIGNNSPLNSCIGFIDGTVRAMCRPTYDQQHSYNGHKRKHALKFQSIMAPNGIIMCMHGPYAGRRHDSHLLRESGILDQLEALPTMPDGTPLVLYGDPAYPSLPNLKAPHRGNNLTPAQQRYNKAMSRVRESVEYGFGKIEQYWAFCDFKKNLKLYLQPIGKVYLVATLLTNCHTCMYGCAVNGIFDSTPPTIEEYLSQ